MPRFLIVDDDAATVRGLTRLLVEDGHDVVGCDSGEKALEALGREPFDVVVTDLEMPEVDGHAVVQATREKLPDACLVVATSHASLVYKALAHAGVCIIADKPYDYDDITRKIMNCRAQGPSASGKCHMRGQLPEAQLTPFRRKF